ncbi:MAG TPA: hypothetical protein VF647_14375 [Longimicrobium sp.]
MNPSPPVRVPRATDVTQTCSGASESSPRALCVSVRPRARWLRVALAFALAAGAVGNAAAQEESGAGKAAAQESSEAGDTVAREESGAGYRAPEEEGGAGHTALVDVGIHTGGSYTTNWFTTPGVEGEEGWDPGYAPTFGAFAQLWLDPRFGVRVQGTYLPENLPNQGALDQSTRVVNSYLYDVDLVLRPFILSTPNTLLQTVYLYVGAGGYTADIGDFMAPGDEGACIPHESWTPAGVCVSTDPDYSTTGMAVAGAGISLARVTDDVEAFGEIAVHAYDSPAHVADGAAGKDRLTFTPRAVIGLKVGLGRRATPAARRIPPPAPLPAPQPPAPVPPAPEPVTPQLEQIQVCVISNGTLADVAAQRDPVSGDTTVAGQPFTAALPQSESAASAPWFVTDEPVTFGGRRFVKFGLPRLLRAGDVVRVGEFRGVGVFAEPNVRRTEVIYLPTGSGCELQPYQLEVKVGAVRG